LFSSEISEVLLTADTKSIIQTASIPTQKPDDKNQYILTFEELL